MVHCAAAMTGLSKAQIIVMKMLIRTRRRDSDQAYSRTRLKTILKDKKVSKLNRSLSHSKVESLMFPACSKLDIDFLVL